MPPGATRPPNERRPFACASRRRAASSHRGAQCSRRSRKPLSPLELTMTIRSLSQMPIACLALVAPALFGGCTADLATKTEGPAAASEQDLSHSQTDLLHANVHTGQLQDWFMNG